jgi:monofunctional biosynthetic peptidoglycan transglycosylase
MMMLVFAAMAVEPLPQLEWQVVNDTVMGGVSNGAATPIDDGQLRFEGRLSLKNNGGFVSVRSWPADLGLDDARELVLRVRGDGRTWNFNAYHEDVRMRAGSYRVPVPTVAGEVTEVVVALADFEPTSFGRPVMGAPTLDSRPDRIDRVGFLLGDKSPGPFALEVLSIEVVEGRRERGPGARGVVSRLSEAVDAGVSAFNRGDEATCRDLYSGALRVVVGSPALTDGERRTVRNALATAANQRSADASWTLRHAIDTVLGGGVVGVTSRARVQ